MKVLLNVTLGEIANKINRQIEVDENISLRDLCEYIIVSMNGSKIPIYEFVDGNITYNPYFIEETNRDKYIDKILFKDLHLKKDKQFTLEYNFDKNYYFEIVVDDIYESQDKSEFKVISGKGYGIIDNKSLYDLMAIFKYSEDRLLKTEKEYLKKTFDCDECNNNITNYIADRKEMFLPKRFVFNVSLYGFEKEIKRKIIVDNDISISDFCKCVIVAMNGDLSHLYGIKMGKEYLNEWYDDLGLFYLNLKEKQKLKIIYDWGDNWLFNLTLSKIIPIDDYGDEDFQVISGKGYGIIDDAGGVWRLRDIFDGTDTSWGIYDINDFDLNECNENIRKYAVRSSIKYNRINPSN